VVVVDWVTHAFARIYLDSNHTGLEKVWAKTDRSCKLATKRLSALRHSVGVKHQERSGSCQMLRAVDKKNNVHMLQNIFMLVLQASEERHSIDAVHM
jgi:hypothetical protein